MFRTLHLTAIVLCCHQVQGETYSTKNFSVVADSNTQVIALTAERYRSELAQRWFQKELEAWDYPCSVLATPALLPNGNSSFLLKDGDKPYDWRVDLHGSTKDILESVIPHEVTHLVLASHFRRKLPIWIDEGLASTTESPSEQARLAGIADQAYLDGSFINIVDLLQTTEYPKDKHKNLCLYAQSYSVVKFLISKNGERHLLSCVKIAYQKGWTGALQDQYGYDELSLERDWLSTFRRLHRPKIRPR